ncbi:uncharacterized protein LOC113024475 isoform X2 [Astatotilapia calliptera]|uniref:uncharacterized protein LOC113024475 isoform X2 n=1 Tax=Astatotilapia calliptera TaxID=8154 RepID=UPI000E41184B|nr:uncharacterized protein LOC113024475 isoform X2 [Astatotilapia calliptera]
MYDYVTPAPPPNTSTPKKRKCPAQQDEDGPYVKKPPNAFMLYLKEQRPKVIAELNIPGSAAVNAVVGQRWKSLSNDQKARYFKQDSLDSPVAALQFQTEEAFVADSEEELLSVLEELDPLPITAQSQQPSPTPASPVDASQTASVQPRVELFQDRDEPICFAEIQEDMWSVLDYLPVSQQSNVLSSPHSHNYSTPKQNLICPADSPPSKLASSPVAFTELPSTTPIFCQLMKNNNFIIDDWTDFN